MVEAESIEVSVQSWPRFLGSGGTVHGFSSGHSGMRLKFASTWNPAWIGFGGLQEGSEWTSSLERKRINLYFKSMKTKTLN